MIPLNVNAWCEQWEHTDKVCAKVHMNYCFKNCFSVLCVVPKSYLYSVNSYNSTIVNFNNRLRVMETKLSNIVDNINIIKQLLQVEFICQTDDNILMAHLSNMNTISSESVVSLTVSLVAEQKDSEKRIESSAA